MKSGIHFVLLVGSMALVLTGCSVAKRQQVRMDRPEPVGLHPAYKDIVAANRELSRRMEAGDLRGVAAMYADDAVLLGPQGQRVSGRDAIDAYWTGFDKARRWRLDVLGLDGEDDLVVQRGRSAITFAGQQGETVSTVEFIVVWRKQPDGEYKVAVDAYWSSPDEVNK